MKVGFIGLGMQGKYMAINLAEAGYDLMVYDTRPEPLAELAAVGAKIARSNAEVARHAEIVQVCVLNDVQVEAVVAGPAGLLETATAGTIVVIHSTIEPATIEKLAPLAAQKNVEILDVPVSGSETRRKGQDHVLHGRRLRGRASRNAGRCSKRRDQRSSTSASSAPAYVPSSPIRSSSRST